MEAARLPRLVLVQLRGKRTDMSIGAGEVSVDWPTRPNAGDSYSNQYSNAVRTSLYRGGHRRTS
jgi:hypothetical protein